MEKHAGDIEQLSFNFSSEKSADPYEAGGHVELSYRAIADAVKRFDNGNVDKPVGQLAVIKVGSAHNFGFWDRLSSEAAARVKLSEVIFSPFPNEEKKVGELFRDRYLAHLQSASKDDEVGPYVPGRGYVN